jgi:hypothetical protein
MCECVGFYIKFGAKHTTMNKIETAMVQFYLLFADTAATTSSMTTRPHHAHDPKQRKA